VQKYFMRTQMHGTPTGRPDYKCKTWPNQKPEVDLQRYVRHLVKSKWRQNPSAIIEFAKKSVGQCRIIRRREWKSQNWSRK